MKTLKWLVLGLAAALLPLVTLSAVQRRQHLAQRVHSLEQATRTLPIPPTSPIAPWWARDWETTPPATRS
jgi:hypothetical protein